MLSGLHIALQGVGFGAAVTALQGFVEVAAEVSVYATGGGGGRRRIEQSRSLNDLLRKALRKPKPFTAVAAVIEEAVEQTSVKEVEASLEALPSLAELGIELRVVNLAVIRYARQKLEKLREAEEEEFVVMQLLLT